MCLIQISLYACPLIILLNEAHQYYNKFWEIRKLAFNIFIVIQTMSNKFVTDQKLLVEMYAKGYIQ